MMNKLRQLINPHAHSDNSLDGASTVSTILKYTKSLGATHATLTEHGNMNSAMELYTTAQKIGIKPILGIEAYMVNPFLDDYVACYKAAYAAGQLTLRSKNEDAVAREIERKALHDSYLHITIHFKDAWAYKYFCGLSKAMWGRAIKKFDEMKPMITLEELRGAAGHITIGSSCMRGPVQFFLMGTRNNVMKPNPQRAEQMYNILREIAGKDSFVVEVFPHAVTHDWQKSEFNYATKQITKPGFFKPNECTCDYPDGDRQKPLNQFVLNMSKKYGDPALISLDSHFAKPEHKVIQDAKLGNGTEQWKFYESYHIMSSEDAGAKLKASLGLSDLDIERMVDNSYQWASLFDNFKIPTSKDRWILHGDADAFYKRLKTTIDKYGRMNWDDKDMLARLKEELRVLAGNGKVNLLSYFATVEDIANFCRENDVLINVRGSAGGSLLLYLIGVSSVNPLKHDLSFERFLTEGRIKANTLPDADIDVSDQDKVIQYLREKYGEGVCRLSTDLNLRIKMAIKDAERAAFGHVRPATETLTKKLPVTPQGVDDSEFVFGYTDKTGVEHKGLIDLNPALKQYSEENPEVWNTISEMLGIQRNKSTHACGFVITGNPVTDYFPIIQVNDEWTTAFSPKSIENAGGVKYDILGLNTLRDIQNCLASIKSRLGQTINPWDLPHDEECFRQFALGHTETVFQFDTTVVRPYLIKIRPKTVDDLAAITALCRPGTLDAPSGDGRTLSQVYVDRAQGEPIEYVHPDLEPILRQTMGIQLYQEQTLRIYRDIGGFSYEEAESVRRGIGKKDEKVLLESTTRLKQTCLSKGWTEEQVDIMIEQIMASARYSFNKSHAVSYAYVAYACMYLKTNYKLDWWKATLTNADKKEIASKFWKYVKTFTVLPDINQSSHDYRIVDDKIITPLNILNQIGAKAYEQLTKHAPYKDLTEFVSLHLTKRTRGNLSAVNVGVARKLIAAGILDSMFPKDSLTVDKLALFEQIRSEVRKEKREPVPEEYQVISDLGQYLLRKQIVSIYSEDLREIILPMRGGNKVNFIGQDAHFWATQDRRVILDGIAIDKLKQICETEDYDRAKILLDRLIPDQMHINGYDGSYNFGAVGYVIDEKAFTYRNKTKQRTDLVLDINGFFTEELMWPAYGEDIAPIGFKGLPVLVQYRINDKGLQFKGVVPFITQENLSHYNVK
jgi:DNA polymerase-3 subunit alpha